MLHFALIAVVGANPPPPKVMHTSVSVRPLKVDGWGDPDESVAIGRQIDGDFGILMFAFRWDGPVVNPLGAVRGGREEAAGVEEVRHHQGLS